MKKILVMLAMASLLIGCALSSQDEKNLQSLGEAVNSWNLQQQKERKEVQDRMQRQMEQQRETDCTGFMSRDGYFRYNCR